MSQGGGAGSLGRVWLVGAGPGDAELLTLRARRVIEQADAVVHDRLVGPGVLDLIPAGVLRVDVGKTGFGSGTPQAEIHASLIRLARAGLDVVRLKGGDPVIFGRGGEEAEALHDAGIPFEVVPGVTAGIAGPALADIPLTHRGTARAVVFVSASGAADGSGDHEPDWEALARIDTVVLYMAGRRGPAAAQRLMEAGRAAATPAALIIDASLRTQEVHVADLATLAASAADPSSALAATDGRAVLLVIGDVVGQRARVARHDGGRGARVGNRS